MEVIKRKVRVSIEKEIEVELNLKRMGYESEQEYLKDFVSGLWDVDGIDDVLIYAAKEAALVGSGYSHDGLGLMKDNNIGGEPDTLFKETEFDITAEIV